MDQTAAPRSASCRSGVPRHWWIPSASSRACAPRATSSPASMTGPTSSSSIRAASSTAPSRESLSAIGEAMAENGNVIVTGCMGAEPEQIEQAYPGVLSITGPQQYESVLDAVHRALPPAHNPHLDLVPPQGIKLTPRHYAIEDLRGLQQPLHLLHHPEAARRSRLASGQRRAARGRAPRRCRRQGAAGDLAGHLRLRRRSQIRREPVEGSPGPRRIPRPRARARRASAPGSGCNMSTPTRMSTRSSR